MAEVASQSRPLDGHSGDALLDYTLIKDNGAVEQVLYPCTGKMHCSGVSNILLRLGLWHNRYGEWWWFQPQDYQLEIITHFARMLGRVCVGKRRTEVVLSTDRLDAVAIEFLMLELTAGMRAAAMYSSDKLENLSSTATALLCVRDGSVWSGPWSYEHYVRTSYGPLGFLLLRKTGGTPVLPSSTFNVDDGMPKVGGYLNHMLQHLHGAHLHDRMVEVLKAVKAGTYHTLEYYEPEVPWSGIPEYKYYDDVSSRGYYLNEHVPEVTVGGAQ